MRPWPLPAVLLAGLFCLLIGAALPAWALQPIPPPAGHVTDLTGSLDAAQAAALEQQLAAFEARRGSQVAVLIVSTTQPESIEDYAIRVAEQWKVGRRRIDDGAILVIALRDRQLRIEVGYGLEGVLPDAVAHRIVDETIVPRLQAQDLPGALAAGVDRILRSIEGEALPPPPAAAAQEQGWMPYLGTVAMAAWFAGAVLRRLVGRPVAALLAAGAAGGGVWWLTTVPMAGLAAAVLAAVVVLIGGVGGLRGPGPPWGGSGRRDDGRGDGGGFRGGGGGFGGGGASGRW